MRNCSAWDRICFLCWCNLKPTERIPDPPPVHVYPVEKQLLCVFVCNLGVICKKSLIQPSCSLCSWQDKANDSLYCSSIFCGSGLRSPLPPHQLPCLFFWGSPNCLHQFVAVALEQELENVVHPLAVFGGRQGAGSSWCRISRYFSLSNGTQRIWHRLYVWKCRHCYHFDIYGMFFFVLFVFGFFWTGGAVRSQWSSFTFSSIFFVQIDVLRAEYRLLTVFSTKKLWKVFAL